MAVIIGGVDPRSAYQGDVSEISDSIAITDNRSPMWPSLYDPRDKHNSLVDEAVLSLEAASHWMHKLKCHLEIETQARNL